jgi:hypothetical protein
MSKNTNSQLANRVEVEETHEESLLVGTMID